ncbi:MAG: Lipopolysaccharide biosynthesis protein [uncultured bacterium]|nr:MAG: Lipopolysaccharide biosynthesis protein [uncultured bacterium]
MLKPEYFLKRKLTFTKNNSSVTYSIIPWDSQYLNNQTVEIHSLSYKLFPDLVKSFALFKQKLKFAHPDLFYVKIPSSNVELIQTFCRLGFYPVELLVDLTMDLVCFNFDSLKLPENLTGNYHLRLAKTTDTPGLLKIAQTAFKFDRYHLDYHLPQDSANNRFYKWMENSLNSKEQVYAFVNKLDAISGFFIVKKIDRVKIDLRLAALHPDVSGTGLGLILYAKMCKLLKFQKYQAAHSRISINNIKVINIFIKLKCARLKQPQMVLHYMI